MLSLSPIGSESESGFKSKSIYQTSSCSRKVRTKYSIVDNEAENKSPKKDDVKMDTAKELVDLVRKPFRCKFDVPQSGRETGSSAPIEKARSLSLYT